MSLRPSRWIAAAALTAGAVAATPLDLESPQAAAALERIRPEALKAHIDFLADDLLEGRGTGTKGHLLAARYVAAQLESLGITPAGERGTYFQDVPLRQALVKPDASRLTIAIGGRKEVLEHLGDCIVGAHYFGETASVSAGVVFVGYGITAPERRYDDYARVDVKGKIVAMLYGAPSSFPSTARAHYSSGVVKAKQAVDRGAVGIITFDVAESESRYPWASVVANARQPRMRWVDASGHPQDAFREIRGSAYVNQNGAESLFQGARPSLARVYAAAKAGKLQAFALPATATIETTTSYAPMSSPNVVGVLAGSDPKLKDEYVVYTAHLDHLGVGEPVDGDAIYNGASDDASGVAGLIEVARAFASLPERPRRSILFLAVTAEEKGLLGSDYYAHHPTVPIGAIVADVNIDGISMLYPIKDVVGLGAEDSSIGKAFEKAAARLGLETSPDPVPEQAFFIRSDQYSFVRQGVPSIFVDAGLKSADPNVDGRAMFESWMQKIYHSPKDDTSQKMDFEAGAKLARLQFLIGLDVASTAGRPTWNPGDFFGETYARGH